MATIIPFAPKAHAKAKAELKAALAKGQTQASTATTPAGKQKLADKIVKAKQTKSKLASPGELARCRAVVGGDWRAAMLLYRIAHLWRTIHPKLTRHGKEYLAMQRADWAMSAGLSEAEMNKYALPRLRKYGFGIVEAAAMGRGADKKLWINLDPVAYHDALNSAGYELKVAANEGLPLYP